MKPPAQPRQMCGLPANGDAAGAHWRACDRERHHYGPCRHHPVERDERPAHGIDVAALTRAADEVLVLTRAEELRQMAVETRDAAVAKQRRKYLKKWARFYACELCGDRPPYITQFGPPDVIDRCAKCDGAFVEHRRDL